MFNSSDGGIWKKSHVLGLLGGREEKMFSMKKGDDTNTHTFDGALVHQHHLSSIIRSTWQIKTEKGDGIHINTQKEGEKERHKKLLRSWSIYISVQTLMFCMHYGFVSWKKGWCEVAKVLLRVVWPWCFKMPTARAPTWFFNRMMLLLSFAPNYKCSRDSDLNRGSCCCSYRGYFITGFKFM